MSNKKPPFVFNLTQEIGERCPFSVERGSTGTFGCKLLFQAVCDDSVCPFKRIEELEKKVKELERSRE